MISDHSLMVHRDPQGSQLFGEKGGVGVDYITQKKLGTDAEYLRCTDGLGSVAGLKNFHTSTCRFPSKIGYVTQSGHKKPVNIIPRSRQFVNQKKQQKTCNLLTFVV
jgi:hypothetical protein